MTLLECIVISMSMLSYVPNEIYIENSVVCEEDTIGAGYVLLFRVEAGTYETYSSFNSSIQHHNGVISIEHGSSSSTAPMRQLRTSVGQLRFIWRQTGPDQGHGDLAWFLVKHAANVATQDQVVQLCFISEVTYLSTAVQ